MQGDFGFVLAIGVGLVLALIFMWMSRAGLGVERSFKRRDAPICFKNQGTHLTNAVNLSTGAYKVLYTFDTITKVDLIELSTGDHETLLIKSGSGSMSFTIEQQGRYAFEVDPQDDSAAWIIEISPLGLPSHHP